MPSFGQQRSTSALLSHPNRLSNPFQSGSCQKKSCSASQTALCASEVDLGFYAWMEEGGAAECPAGALFRVALWAQQAAVSLNNPAPVWHNQHYTASQWTRHAVSTTSKGFRIHGDLMVRFVSSHPKCSDPPIHWSICLKRDICQQEWYYLWNQSFSVKSWSSEIRKKMKGNRFFVYFKFDNELLSQLVWRYFSISK